MGCLLLTGAQTALGDKHKAILLYPELRAPYSNVFEDIIKGVGTGFDGEIQRVTVKKTTTADDLKSVIDRARPHLIFALGKSSLKSIANVNTDAPILTAGVTKNGPSTAGISMLPDPRVVFEKLFLLKGQVNKVYVVSRGNRYDEQLESAASYLSASGSALEFVRVSSIQEAARAYRNILDKVEPGDAIWILPSAPYLDNSVLSVILEHAWKRRILVFSSNPSHVRRGVLFAVYPDNQGMGQSLGKLANRVVAKEDVAHGLLPLQDVLLAVNERTTKHLGIDLDEKARSEIDLMLPAR